MRLVEEPFVDRYYRCLTRMDLAGDAADLYRGGEPDAALAQAYREAPARLLAQVLPLLFDDEASLLAFLQGSWEPSLARALARAYRASEATPGEPGFGPWQEEVGRLLEAVAPGLPLAVYSAPSLTTGVFTHGRAVRVGDEGRIAVSFRCPPEHTALQVLHETLHLVGDEEILARLPGEVRDTRLGSAGFAAYALLERTVVELTGAVLEAECPRLLPYHEEWCKYFGVLPGDGRDHAGGGAHGAP